MPTKIPTAEEAAAIARDVDAEVEAFLRALDRGWVDAAIKNDEAKFSEVGEYLPRHDKDAGVRKIREKHEKAYRERANVAATRLGVLLNDSPDLRAAADHYAEAPDIVPAFERHSGKGGTSEAGYLALLNLEAALTPQVEAQIRRTSPSATDRWYDSLLADPDEPRHAVAIRLIEAAHRDAWTGPAFDPLAAPAEVEAVRRLQRKIAETRAARVPREVTEALALVEKGRKILDVQMRLRRLHLVSRHEVSESA